ncbi:MAG: glutamine-hydrolyzing carbamoyl-phosphate synthase small subunit [Spirochaetes bacterium]|nr:glutamine-hydrolyzing carbamoyl-phosphate synthase small subunit [Spirochaetota bacterium]
MRSKTISARLVLADGTEFPGRSFGAPRSSPGEVVFSTGMVGYPQSLTDPSYRGQILTLTYPLVGNYGVPDKALDRRGIPINFESEKIQVSGLVVSELCEVPSHYSSKRSLSAWMEAEGISGISGIDTRALTQRLREEGVMRGRIVVDGGEEGALENPEDENLVAAVSCVRPMEYKGKPGMPRIAVVDCGVKANILRIILATGASIARVPWDSDLRSVSCDGIFLSNGPGDPKTCTRTIAAVRRALAGEIPVFGICLGNQILGLAAGADTYKLPYGHRGQNQPALEVGTKRCYMTSQNHGYAVREDSLPKGWEPWFVNGNDRTLEGIRSKRGPFSAVQFHPEGCPGPRDTQFLLENFVAEAAATAARRIARHAGSQA